MLARMRRSLASILVVTALGTVPAPAQEAPPPKAVFEATTFDGGPVPPGADGDEAHNPGVEAEHSESMMESMEMKPEGEALLRGRGDDENKLWDDPDENEEDDVEDEDDDGDDDDDDLDDDDEDFEEDDLDDLDIDLDDDDDDE